MCRFVLLWSEVLPEGLPLAPVQTLLCLLQVPHQMQDHLLPNQQPQWGPAQLPGGTQPHVSHRSRRTQGHGLRGHLQTPSLRQTLGLPCHLVWPMGMPPAQSIGRRQVVKWTVKMTICQRKKRQALLCAGQGLQCLLWSCWWRLHRCGGICSSAALRRKVLKTLPALRIAGPAMPPVELLVAAAQV